jgi:hypothetical protein
MSRRAFGLICVITALVVGCTPAGHQAQVSRSHARWAIYVPPGWHALRFNASGDGARLAGIQVSNVRLPAPASRDGSPAEINAAALPPSGVGLVIATAVGRTPANVKVAARPLPLPWPDGSRGWLLSSSPRSSPVYEWLWFRIGGVMHVAVVTIGPKASRVAQQALAPIVRSINGMPASAGLLVSVG